MGRSIVEAFVAEGARVLIADLEPAEGEVAAIHLDVTSAGGWAAAVGRILAMWGGVDILINNAGVASSLVQIGDRTPDEWDRMMQVNAKGCFLGTQAVLPAFCAQGGGTIVNVSSVAGLGQSQIMDPAYARSKAALAMLTKVTAAQHAAEGIRCNAVHPGPIDSGVARMAYADAEAFRRRISRIPMGRFGSMDEIVAAILFLACDESSYITGVSLAVDGGALVQ
ncbi:hypothetical protein NX02_06305 [Sphingomonas sanxanigenens DSM 19645 = NX02]|uniref:Short-chain dehydrogenase n=1 Tax=Sphingomonas sanxanigenens DSM 19645 = NX02 TaxID=1123269 RepID=W0A7C9_9SPHN|nr:hypothetical protein NX02_06305 [Sphingomonas sanxanigenens DSM 19645 = NX02]